MQTLLTDSDKLAQKIRGWGLELGFQAISIARPDLRQAELRHEEWLKAGFHGEMNYMASHGTKRSRPEELLPGTLTVISARLDYLPPDAQDSASTLANPDQVFISRYALGRDYHKTMRNRLQRLATRIEEEIGSYGYRVFTDSAPVMEVEIASQAGLGWKGKHSLLLTRERGSWFFLGEIYTDLSLPSDPATANHCGSCTACIQSCPTGAIVAPYQVDARRCISYLTIELKGAIPEEFRKPIGNRIYGCDDCQLACPWNRFAQNSVERDFAVRHHLDNISLLELFAWDEQTFTTRMSGSAIFRIGHERWLRNIAVALGNAPTSRAVIESLTSQRAHPSALVREHVEWALAQHEQSCDDSAPLKVERTMPQNVHKLLTDILDVRYPKTACSTCDLRDLWCLPIGLKGDDFHQLDTVINRRTKVKRGEHLFKTGDPFKSLYALRTGFFKTMFLTENGNEHITGFHMTGELLGLDAICTDSHSCNATALEDSELCEIPYEALGDLCREIPSLQHQFHKIMSREIHRDHSLMALLSSMNAEERVAAFLINLSQRLAARGYSPSQFQLRMTRSEIGNYLGLKLETVSRTLSRFQDDGLISVQSKHLVLNDLNKLRSVADQRHPRIIPPPKL
ncbi:MAG: tRNA epoxyqueuosine(34) reductase QueG [Sulfuricellaceae bacterium]|nr:tRNA epoxyqueuosine(34) reductase QueG [Sulfuricellaceae bacterium]